MKEEHVAFYASLGFTFPSGISASGSIWNGEHFRQMSCTVFPYVLIFIFIYSGENSLSLCQCHLVDMPVPGISGPQRRIV